MYMGYITLILLVVKISQDALLPIHKIKICFSVMNVWEHIILDGIIRSTQLLQSLRMFGINF